MPISLSTSRIVDRSVNAAPLAAVMASATIYTILQSLTYPLLALVLHERHVAEGWVGVNAAMMPVGMLVAAGLAPRIVGRFGLYKTCIGSLLTVGCCMVGIGVFNSYWYWMPLRFLTGLLLSCIFVATDTWINELAEERLRGRIVGIYAMLLSVGCIIGPGILSLTGARGFLPFGITAVLPFCAAFPLFLARGGVARVSYTGRVLDVCLFETKGFSTCADSSLPYHRSRRRSACRGLFGWDPGLWWPAPRRSRWREVSRVLVTCMVRPEPPQGLPQSLLSLFVFEVQRD